MYFKVKKGKYIKFLQRDKTLSEAYDRVTRSDRRNTDRKWKGPAKYLSTILSDPVGTAFFAIKILDQKPFGLPSKRTSEHLRTHTLKDDA